MSGLSCLQKLLLQMIRIDVNMLAMFCPTFDCACGQLHTCVPSFGISKYMPRYGKHATHHHVSSLDVAFDLCSPSFLPFTLLDPERWFTKWCFHFIAFTFSFKPIGFQSSCYRKSPFSFTESVFQYIKSSISESRYSIIDHDE